MIINMNNQNNEQNRREAALNAFGGEIEKGAHEVVGREILQMISVRIEPDLIAELREVATDRGVKVSDLLREAAAKLVSDYRTPTVSVRAWQVTKSTQIDAKVSASWWSGSFTHREQSGSFGFQSV